MENIVVLPGPGGQGWIRYHKPKKVMATQKVDQVLALLQRVEYLVARRQWHAVGFISYEASPAFDHALQTRRPGRFPLAWFALYEGFDTIKLEPGPYTLGVWTPLITQQAHAQGVSRIKQLIADGDTYQVNFTFRQQACFKGDALALFLDLYQAQPSEYAAYVDMGELAVCSASPELFFRLRGQELVSRPMKGTAARGMTLAQDQSQAQWLRLSEKNRAENVMIVDMVRNDMGRIAVTGSVETASLFDIEKYPTVWQMTSSVRAKTHAGVSEILAALFPCASITGAPKPHTMEIIASLEQGPRQVYTGCIGWIRPNRHAQFNVAIRTVLIDREQRRAEYGVGGGIVWDSTSREEYEECRTKAKFLTEKRPVFHILETMLWTPDHGFFLLDYHLKRAGQTADYFDFCFDPELAKRKLTDCAGSLEREPHRIRMLISNQGGIALETCKIAGSTTSIPVRLKLALDPVDTADPFLYYKTTHRAVYEKARKGCSQYDDVLLWNRNHEITEATIYNVVFEMQGKRITPPVSSGLLAGTFRAWLLDQGQIQEQTIKKKDIVKASAVYVINSVRKWQEAVVIA